jgi:succinate-acetate transporter protein
MAQNIPFQEQKYAQPGPQTVATNIAAPGPLGLNILAFLTALVGCFYAGFIIPYESTAVRPALGAMLLAGGIVLLLAGMWEFRKNYMVTATIFTSYGGFLAALGLIFLPSVGILSALQAGGALHYTLGLIFLCWTIFVGVLFIGSLRSNASLAATMGVLFLAYLLLTIGQLAGSTILVVIGGWLAIVCALVAWLAALASIVSTPSAQGAFRLPLARRIAVVE